MTKAQAVFTGRAKLDAPSPRQKPLGVMLFDARKEKGWSRAYLSTATGINANSIAKYEQAGIDEDDGRFPTSPKLSILCLALEIDPMQAMLACVPKNDYGMYEQEARNQTNEYDHPQTTWLAGQMETALRENMLLKNFCELLMANIDTSDMDANEKWLAEEGAKLVGDYHNLEARMLQIGVFNLPFGAFTMPSGCSDEDNVSWMYNLQSKAVADEKTPMPLFIQKSLDWYAKSFVRLAEQYGRLRDDPEMLERRSDYKVLQKELLEEMNELEDESLATASSSSKSTLPDQRKEVDDG